MAVSTVAYTTKEKVKTQVGLGDTSQDANLDALILAVSRLFDELANVEFGTTEQRVEYHDGGSACIFLDGRLSEVTASREALVLKENGVTLDQTPGATQEYHIDPWPSNTIWRVEGDATDPPSFGLAFEAGCRNLQVTYTPAYETIPSDIGRAATEETARAFLLQNTPNIDGNRIGITQRTPEAGTSLSFTLDDLSPATLRMLDAYRKSRRFI